MRRLRASLARLDRVADPLIAAAFALAWLGGLVVANVGGHDRVRLAVECVLVLGMTVPFAWRRTHPAVALACLFGCSVVQALVSRQEGDIAFVVAVLLGAYSLGAHGVGRRATIVLVLVVATGVAETYVTSTENIASKLLTAPIFVLLPWAVGRIVRRTRVQSAALAELNAQLERDREVMARAAALEERARIARELHDIVAHSISVMVVQAGAAEQVVGQDAPAREPLAVVRSTGRQALVEMRRLLGVLRTDDPAVLVPQPRIAEIPALVAQIERDGLAVAFTISGTPRDLPAGVESAAYRLVQEALSNIRKHARATSVDVELEYAADALRIRVGDDGVGSPETAVPGHGLVGMRERVAMFGGSLVLGRAGRRGWAVDASLPVVP